ncbi:uncharacterized protein Eint_091950 [Encephalitozoon intestinalis ATCC 50506]|uniref:Uncharacterized protein n=1 Tax=Encephalitozoon intestinalis (strain ATCC 50506) TaxID=876142 RepID=E0S986_ENCIT|nr:uncharacterized protein Eint_091950 [Encephalitozoon intestinalis ATCC 50506]ADM12321.2 hypothetical protein Eint_091950 [Encephalitozoon intestinalis ATCC 50506]UTX46133.1 Rab GTPase-activating protein 1 [Encephalitozoon intestinalis]
MEFLDRLILGSRTPRYADEALFPSRTYKKPMCNRKHCNTSCTSRVLEEFEFWAYFLSEKEPNRREVRKKIHTMSKDLRFSIWIKCVGSREKFIRMKEIGLSNTKEARDVESKEDGNRKLDDKGLVKFILDMCRDAEGNNQEAIFNILKNLERDFSSISNKKLLALTIMHILELPYASPQTTYRFIHSLMESHNFCSVFSGFNESELDNGMDQDDENSVHSAFWKFIISENALVFDRIIDLLVCYEGANIASVPTFLKKQTGDNDVQKWVEFISVRSNLDKLGSVFDSERLEGPTEVEDREETYFDFLVIQNETIKAQEMMKIETNEKLNSLKEERDELYAQKVNLMEACSSLESDLKEYQKEYVKKVEEMLHSVEDKCEKYEKENMELKAKVDEKEQVKDL